MSNHYKVTYTPQALQDLTELYALFYELLKQQKISHLVSEGLFVHLI